MYYCQGNYVDDDLITILFGNLYVSDVSMENLVDSYLFVVEMGVEINMVI